MVCKVLYENSSMASSSYLPTQHVSAHTLQLRYHHAQVARREFLVMTDVGITQNPMFRPTPQDWAVLLPGYGPARAMYDAAFSQHFHADNELLLGIGWLIVIAVIVYLVLRRAVSPH